MTTGPQAIIAKPELRGLLPHSGTMCLLDGVLAWDDDSVSCISASHRDPDNPLRRSDSGRLAALHAFEYAAQAVAVHGALLARRAGAGRVEPRYLAALKNGRLYVDYLDDIAAVLSIVAYKRLGDTDGGQFIYDAEVSAGGQAVAEVRLTVMGAVAHG